MADQPPPRMTWGKALPVLAVAGIFDGLRYACLGLVFFAPAALGFVVAAETGSQTLGAAAAAFSGVVEVATGAIAGIIALGVVLSISVAVLGLIAMIFWLLLTNGRIFKDNPWHLLWALEGAVVSLFAMMFFLYRDQIKKDRKTHRDWERKNAARTKQEQERKAAEFSRALQETAAVQAEEEQQAAENEEEEAVEQESAFDSFEPDTSGESPLPEPANGEIPEEQVRVA